MSTVTDTRTHTDEPPALAVAGLRRRFAGIVAVDGVTFDVDRAEVLGLIGPNGSGKSTLFNLIAGALTPDGGTVRLGGQAVTGWPAWRVARAGLGRTFQIPSLFGNMSVHDNLLAASCEGDWRGAPERARQALALLEIDHVAGNLASELSGGQQKLVEFARVYMRSPRVVLLDEVTAGVHPNIRAIILNAVRAMQLDGATFLLIEHDMELVREVCDRIIVMDFGQVVAEGSFEEIAGNAEVRRAYLGRSE
ncbi:Lipopolysaccharide export system ATP-binding protein LptB [wastewater metagenome]|uniref:Lipopolysaccharide export system ATP-binding protein LptB n=2 Tax=unclassified sequences TaxID=12908 RepID=A0A5B8R770_9ZZZZ|nr:MULTISPECIES: ABC transporter ATP-binding protein [Arhodomonas]MCS4502709.1 ABC transporter ATP-binding protein [Arhodomonas aquaeolei]QEA03808.1 lipopolysaccharide export system ATP-binding protein LptB [uncultured organism]